MTENEKIIEEANKIAKGRMYATNEVIRLQKELEQYRAIGTIEEFQALKEKDKKDFELLLKAVKESYPMFKGAYVELDVFMGDVMRRFTRDRKQS